MVATEHCQAQDKGFGGARNSLADGMVMFFIIVLFALIGIFCFKNGNFCKKMEIICIFAEIFMVIWIRILL